jgi:hypothetical protein
MEKLWWSIQCYSIKKFYDWTLSHFGIGLNISHNHCLSYWRCSKHCKGQYTDSSDENKQLKLVLYTIFSLGTINSGKGNIRRFDVCKNSLYQWHWLVYVQWCVYNMEAMWLPNKNGELNLCIIKLQLGYFLGWTHMEHTNSDGSYFITARWGLWCQSWTDIYIGSKRLHRNWQSKNPIEGVVVGVRVWLGWI